MLQILGLFGLDVVMDGKMFLFDYFFGFCKSFCGSERAFQNSCFISKAG